MKRKEISIVRSVSLGVLVCVVLCLGMGAVESPNRELPPEFPAGLPPGWRRVFDAPTEEERATVMRHLKVNFHMADTSLEVREQVDFLLTPALLVQEAVSDGVVLTYPEE